MSGARVKLDCLSAAKRVGHITPSSNSVLEPITAAMNEPLSNRISHHFTRIVVKQMTTEDSASRQFDHSKMVTAAALLADCLPDAIVWNGTAGSWLGLKYDDELCRQIEDRTGIAASTSTLAFHKVFQGGGFERIALAVPYTKELTQQIVEVYGRHGIKVVSEAHLGQFVNTEVGKNSFDTLRRLLRDADSDQAQCIAVVCTNVAATALVEELEAEIGKPIIDSIAVTFWQACRMAGVEPRLEGWGALMRGDVV